MLAVLTRPIGDLRILVALGVGAIALFLGLWFSAQAGLLFLAGAWIAVGTWRYPWPAFLLLVAGAPFLPILKATVVLGPLTLLKDVVILTLFVRALRAPGPLPEARLALSVLALVAWAAVALLRADATAIGILRFRDLVLYVPLLLVAARLVSSAQRLRIFLGVFLSAAALVLSLALVQRLVFPDGMVLRFDPGRSLWIPRAASVLAHPNILGGLLLFVVPLAGALALLLRERPLRLTSLLLCGGALVALFATYSRGAWLAVATSLAGGVALLALLRQPRLVGSVVLLAVLAGGAAFAVPRTRALLGSILDPAYQSNRTRLDILAGVLADVSNRGAVIGEGLGDTITLLGRQADISLYEIAAAGAKQAQVAKARTFVDNAVLKTFIEQGTVGLVLAGWVAVRLFLLAAARARQAVLPEQRAVGWATASTLLGLATLWLFLDVPDVFPVNLYFWTLAGLVASPSVILRSARYEGSPRSFAYAQDDPAGSDSSRGSPSTPRQARGREANDPTRVDSSLRSE